MEFEFIQPKNQKIETQDLIDDLKNVAKQINKAPSIHEYNEYGKFEETALRRRFGSWNKALEYAGFSPFKNNLPYTDLELFQNIENVWITLQKQPTRREMNSNISKISSGAYLRHFGTWTNALKCFVKYVNEVETFKVCDNSTLNTNAHKTKRDINSRLRFLVMKRDNFKCKYCGRSPSTTPGLELHIDHIKPWSKGGETVIENLQTLCNKCNLGKSNLE